MSFTSLNDALFQYGVESGEIELEVTHPAGEEEITVITDATQSDLEEAVEDMGEKVEKLQEHDANAEKVVEVVESLESYVGQVQAMSARGEKLGAQGAKFLIQAMTASMEGRGMPVQLFGSDMVIMSESFESNQLEDYSQEAEEKGEGLLSKFVKMLQAAASAIKTAIMEFFATIGKSAAAIKAAGAKLKRVGAAAKGTPKVKELSGGSYKTLVVGGKVAPAAALDALKKAYNNDVVKTSVAIMRALKPVTAALQSPTAASLKSAAGAVDTSSLNDHSGELPGGFKAVWKVGQGEGLSRLSGARFGITKPEKSQAPEKAEILTPSEIVALGGKLDEISTLMTSAKKDGDTVISANEQAVAAAAKAVGGIAARIKAKVTGSKSDADKDDDHAARELLKTVKAIMSANKNIVPDFIRHVGTAAKEAYSFGAASAGKYGGKVEAAPDADAKPKDDDKKDDDKKGE
jgi:hypothetical protein